MRNLKFIPHREARHKYSLSDWLQIQAQRRAQLYAQVQRLKALPGSSGLAEMCLLSDAKLTVIFDNGDKLYFS